MGVTALPSAPRSDGGLPTRVSVHKSGGRHLWSEAMSSPPDDPVEATWRILNEVLDPEIPIGLTELGLIYGVEVNGRVARVRLTYTATACPCMEFIREDISDRLGSESWIDRVDLVEVWDPPWTSERITAEGRVKLRALGVSV